jgi:protein kinase-like protein/GAF domain-containing protein
LTATDRRRLIDEICDAALDRGPEERAAFVEASCGKDMVLRREVQALLARVPSAETFLCEPMGAIAASVFLGDDGDLAAVEPGTDKSTSFGPTFPAWPFVLIAVPIVLRAVIFAVGLLTEPWVVRAGRFIPAWIQILQAAVFASLAFLLLRYGRGDRRAWSLGLFVLDAGTTLLGPFVRSITAPSKLTTLAIGLPTDAFQAALLWFFADGFPRPSRQTTLARVFYCGVAVSLILGVVLAGVNIYALYTRIAVGTLSSLVDVLRRNPQSGRDWYFTLQFALLFPLLPLVPLKLREFGPNDRRRFMWLGLGLAVGLFPLVLDTILVTVWPTVANAPVLASRIWGALIVVSLTAIPLAGAYAALVQRTIELRLVLRAALQYVLARSFISVAAAVPFIVLIAIIAANRERSVADLLSGAFGGTLLALTILGVAAAAGRRRLMVAVDTRFYRREIDAKAILVSVSNAVRRTRTLDDFRDTLVCALGRAFHPSTIVSAVVGESDDALHALDADVPPLPRGSALAQLLAGSDQPLALDAPQSSSILARLGSLDREWLQRSRAAIVVSLRGPRDSLLGIVALGEKKSEMAYTEEDLSLLAAVGTAAGLALHRLLFEAKEEQLKAAEHLDASAARECVECGTVFDVDVIACSCGGLLQRSSVPHIFSDRLKFVQRIGQGGAGVVYRAIDLRLRQVRAVKTLPGTDPAPMSHMRREARAMAAAIHPNLATLHGFEEWRGAPMLVMEFLEGGTLAERLRGGSLPLADSLMLGTALANGLAVLHKSGILHRDIKPSNIGFTADGVPKLLDFGLAKLAAASASTSTVSGDQSTLPASMSLDGPGIRGTPAYLSPWILGGAPPSASDDVWSLAVTLLETCTGVNPYRAATVAATIARVLTDAHRVSGVISALPTPARELFAELLLSRRPLESAHQFAAQLQRCAVF